MPYNTRPLLDTHFTGVTYRHSFKVTTKVNMMMIEIEKLERLCKDYRIMLNIPIYFNTSKIPNYVYSFASAVLWANYEKYDDVLEELLKEGGWTSVTKL